MAKFVDPLGVLKTDEFFDDDGFETIMPGEASRRSADLSRYASTTAEITFDNEEDLQRFLSVIEETDRRLAAVTDAEIRARTSAGYDWQRISRRDMTVRFGVMWYDQEFFERRKDAYKSAMHRVVLGDFNVSPDDLSVKHTIL